MMDTAILLSGGMDSLGAAFLMRPSIGIFVNYGQRPAEAEAAASKMLAGEIDLKYLDVAIDCSSIGFGTLSRNGRSASGKTPEFWPYRNQLLASIAGPLALSHGMEGIIFGAVRSDREHRDGRKKFYRLLSKLMEFQEGGIKILAPALDLTTTELLRKARVPIDLLGWTHSCHVSNLACGQCRGCMKRTNVLEALGVLS